jgi:hypothetical protein
LQAISAIAAASLIALAGAARAQTFIVNGNNLDTTVTNEDTGSSQTEGVKDGVGENNGGGTTISASDSGADAYWQGFRTGPSGTITQLTLDLSIVATSPGVNASSSGADTATFYLYSYPDADITAGAQIGPAIATVTAAEIENGTPVGYNSKNSCDIYQYSLISSASSFDLAANTDYAIVMMTSSGSQVVGWAESNNEATGDMGEFDNINTGGNNGGAFGQMELVISTPEPASWMLGALALLLVAGARIASARKRAA